MIKSLPGGFNGKIGYPLPERSPPRRRLREPVRPGLQGEGWEPTIRALRAGIPDFSAIITSSRRRSSRDRRAGAAGSAELPPAGGTAASSRACTSSTRARLSGAMRRSGIGIDILERELLVAGIGVENRAATRVRSVDATGPTPTSTIRRRWLTRTPPTTSSSTPCNGPARPIGRRSSRRWPRPTSTPSSGASSSTSSTFRFSRSAGRNGESMTRPTAGSRTTSTTPSTRMWRKPRRCVSTSSSAAGRWRSACRRRPVAGAPVGDRRPV